MKLQVEYVPITEIKPYRRNAKLHPQEQIEQIKNSMKEFGNIDPKYVDVIINRWEQFTGQKAVKLGSGRNDSTPKQLESVRTE